MREIEEWEKALADLAGVQLAIGSRLAEDQRTAQETLAEEQWEALRGFGRSAKL